MAAILSNQEVDKEMDREIYLTDSRGFIMVSRVKKYMTVLLAFVCVWMIFPSPKAYAADDRSTHESVRQRISLKIILLILLYAI